MPKAPKNKIVRVEARFRGYTEKGFFGGTNEVTSDCQIDTERLEREVQSAIASLKKEGYDVIQLTVTLELPDEVAERARAAGLLEPAQLERLLKAKLAEDGDSRSFFEMARDLRSLPGEPMSLEELQAEVDAVRTERAAREAGR